MNEDLRRNLDKAFLLFTKVYIYNTNTKKPWNRITNKEMNSKKFKWYCSKWFCISKHPITAKEVENHIISCPELVEDKDNVLKNCASPSKGRKHHSVWYDVYDPYPLRNEEQLKILINTIGLRMLHFIEN